MNEPRDNEELAKQAKLLFDDSVERLDAATLSRLNQARHVALDSLHDARPAAPWLRWLPATGVAAVALVTVMVMRGPGTPQMPVVADRVADFELLLDGESLEMLEDLEFYSWLEVAEVDMNGNVG